MKPLLLPPNQFHRFYRGGAAHRRAARRARGRGRPARGLGRLDRDVVRLRDRGPQPARGRHAAARRDRAPTPRPSSAPTTSRAGAPTPRCWSSCSTPASACRSTSTPAAAFAREHLGMRFGKTEAWIILEAEPDAAVHVGPARAARPPTTVRGWVERQDADEMLAALQPRPGRAPATRCSCPPARCTRSAPASCCSSCRSRPTCPCCSSGSRSASTDGAEHLELGLGRAALDARWTRAAPTSPRCTGERRRSTAAARRPPTRTSAPSASRGGAELEPSFAVAARARRRGHAAHRATGDELRAAPRHDRARAVRAPAPRPCRGDVEAIRCLPPVPTAGEGAW